MEKNMNIMQNKPSNEELARMTPSQIEEAIVKFGALPRINAEVGRRIMSGMVARDEFMNHYYALADNEQLVCDACIYGHCFMDIKMLPSKFRASREVSYALMMTDGTEYTDLDYNIRTNPKFAKSVVGKRPERFKEMDPQLRSTYEVVTESVAMSPASFAYAGEDVRKDADYVQRLMQGISLEVLKYAHNDLRNNKTYINKLRKEVSKNAAAYAGDKLLDDKEWVSQVAKSTNPEIYIIAGETPRNDYHLALFCASRLGTKILDSLGNDIKNDREQLANVGLMAHFSQKMSEGKNIDNTFRNGIKLFDFSVGDPEVTKEAMSYVIDNNVYQRLKLDCWRNHKNIKDFSEDVIQREIGKLAQSNYIACENEWKAQDADKNRVQDMRDKVGGIGWASAPDDVFNPRRR